MRRALALTMICFAGRAMAQPVETVTVNGSALAGIWKVDFPTSGQIDYWGRTRWGELQGNFCRIEQAGSILSVRCFPTPGRDGTISVEGNHVHMAWGSMMARIYMDGVMSSAGAFDGHNGIKISGITIENPKLSHGEKLILSPSDTDAGGQAALLTRLLNQTVDGAVAIGPKSSFVQPPDPADLRAMGRIETVIYLGALPKPLPPNSKEPPQPAFYRAYDVEF